MAAHSILFSTKLLAIISIASILCISVDCSNPKDANCRAIFEKDYEVNVKAFMETMHGIDSVAARKRAECMLEKLYVIDSTFVLMKGKKLNDFINNNLHLLEECDSIH